MYKRVVIGLIAAGLVGIFMVEAATALTSRRRRSVSFTATSDNPGTFVTSIFGFPEGGEFGCGEIWGELYCAQNDSEEARLACDIATGDSAAMVLVLDKDTVKAGVPPNYFTQWEVNFDIKGKGQREQLRGFRTRALSPDPNVYVISLPTGASEKKAGVHAITDLSKWNEGGTLTDDQALRKFVGDPLDGYKPEDGFGINGEEFIHKVPGVEPLSGSELDGLVGKTICAAVKHSQVKGNTLKGPYLGLAAFKVLSRSGSLMEVEVQNSNEVCGLPLYKYTSTVETVASGGLQECLVADASVAPEAVVFAPAFSEGELRAGEGKFPAVEGTLVATASGYEESVEVLLDDDVGQWLCEQEYPGNLDVDFVDFIPKNRGGTGMYAEYAFIGLTESANPDAADKVKCKEGVEGGSKFDCEDDFVGDIPTCSFDCGPTYPGGLIGGNYADFLNAVGIGAANCDAVESYGFDDEVWDFRPIGTEAGHTLWTIRDNFVATKIFDSDDCSSMGIARRVYFADEDLVFDDTTNSSAAAEISLDPYDGTDPFPIPGSGNAGRVDVYMCQYNGTEPVVLDYLVDPIAVEAGQYFFFFNDYDPSDDYDDFILLGECVDNCP